MNESLNSAAESDVACVLFLWLEETAADPVCRLPELAEKPVSAISNSEKGQARWLVTLVG
jgi:hypothetical protein